MGSESQPNSNSQQASGRVQAGSSLLMRLVDDFLFITFCPQTAQAIAACLLKGRPTRALAFKSSSLASEFRAIADPQIAGDAMLIIKRQLCQQKCNRDSVNPIQWSQI